MTCLLYLLDSARDSSSYSGKTPVHFKERSKCRINLLLITHIAYSSSPVLPPPPHKKVHLTQCHNSTFKANLVCNTIRSASRIICTFLLQIIAIFEHRFPPHWISSLSSGYVYNPLLKQHRITPCKQRRCFYLNIDGSVSGSITFHCCCYIARALTPAVLWITEVTRTLAQGWSLTSDVEDKRGREVAEGWMKVWGVKGANYKGRFRKVEAVEVFQVWSWNMNLQEQVPTLTKGACFRHREWHRELSIATVKRETKESSLS